MESNFLANLKRVKPLALRPTIDGKRYHNNSLFGMNYSMWD